MDFSLRTLSDAFQRAAYIRDHSQFKLFAFLLATPADRNVFPEVLIYLDEIDWMTGKEILVIAPSVYIGIEGRKATRDEALAVFRTGMYPQYFGRRTELVDVSGEIREFIRNQTEQTYELMDFLGLRRDCLPAIAFFERLTNPTEFIVWEIKTESGDQVILELRHIIEKLRTECNWGIERDIGSVRSKLKSGQYANTWQEQWEVKRLENSIKWERASLELLLSIRDLRDIAETVKDDSSFNMPFASAYQNITRLCENPFDDEYVLYLRRHRRRWRKRMPDKYRKAIERFLAATESCKDWDSQASESECDDERIVALRDSIQNIQQTIEDKRLQIQQAEEAARRELQERLKELEKRMRSPTPSPPKVLQSLQRQRMVRINLTKAGKIVSKLSFIGELFLGG